MSKDRCSSDSVEASVLPETHSVSHQYDHDASARDAKETDCLLSNDVIDTGETSWFISCRHILAIMGFIGLASAQMLRINISVAMTVMVNNSATQGDDGNGSKQSCPYPSNYSESEGEEGEFNWDSHTQELILAAFFYGYSISQIPLGWVSDKIGGKWVFGLGLLGSAVCAMLSPVSAWHSVSVLFVTRFFSGLSEAAVIPSIHALLGEWSPPNERSRLLGISLSGLYIGGAVGQVVSGLLCSSNFLGGWPSSFYVIGLNGIFWSVVWTFFVFDSPACHPRISVAENVFIQKSRSADVTSKYEPRKVPWISILTSIPVWTMIVAQFANQWANFTILTNLPIYLHSVFHFDVSMTGFMSAIPQFFQCLAVLLGGHLADFWITRQTFSVVSTRKILTATGFLGFGTFIALEGYVNCNQILAVVCVCLAVIMNGIVMSGGFYVNSLDIAPRYGGSVKGIINTAGAIAGIIAPYVVGIYTENQADIAGWRTVFWILFGLLVTGAAQYTIFASGEEQSWAR